MTLFRKASEIETRPVEWLWMEHIPVGMIAIIAGRPEQGKSTCTIRIAADISREEHVIVSTYEEPFQEVATPKLKAAGANMDNVDLSRLQFPRDFQKLRNRIKERGTALVILDPIASHTRASIYHVSNIRTSIEPLIDMADKLDCAFLFVHHTIKTINVKSDPLDAVGGSAGGLAAIARCVYLFGLSPDDPDERILAHLKCNIDSARPSLSFELDVESIDEEVRAVKAEYMGRSKYDAADVIKAKPKRSPQKDEAIAEFLIENLREGPMLAERLIDAGRKQGFNLRGMSRVGEFIELRMGDKWELPEDFPDDL